MNPVRSLSEAFTEKDYSKCGSIIDSIDISKLENNMRRGFISLSLRFFFATKNYEPFECIMNSDFNLMKRDYLLYCNYLYHTNIEKAKIVFSNNILANEKVLPTDIDFLIENNFTELIKILNGYYITCSKKENEINISKLKRFNVVKREEEIISHFINLINSSLSKVFNIDLFISKVMSADVLIDGGNVLFCQTDKNIENLINTFSLSLVNFKNPLIIIHQRHKKLMSKNGFYSKNEKNIYLTPFDVYDDYFLILGMIMNKIPIITNDKFRDHIFEIFKIFDRKNNQLSNYIKEMTLSYNQFMIENVSTYSKCIQFDDNYIYIPTKSGFYKMEY
tara:strand:- start:135 stop:1136 length:1002 start_codon:yes stop_codon:yes gene_type:complete